MLIGIAKTAAWTAYGLITAIAVLVIWAWLSGRRK